MKLENIIGISKISLKGEMSRKYYEVGKYEIQIYEIGKYHGG